MYIVVTCYKDITSRPLGINSLVLSLTNIRPWGGH
jgi:hypothetical protein